MPSDVRAPVVECSCLLSRSRYSSSGFPDLCTAGCRSCCGDVYAGVCSRSGFRHGLFLPALGVVGAHPFTMPLPVFRVVPVALSVLGVVAVLLLSGLGVFDVLLAYHLAPVLPVFGVGGEPFAGAGVAPVLLLAGQRMFSTVAAAVFTAFLAHLLQTFGVGLQFLFPSGVGGGMAFVGVALVLLPDLLALSRGRPLFLQHALFAFLLGALFTVGVVVGAMGGPTAFPVLGVLGVAPPVVFAYLLTMLFTPSAGLFPSLLPLFLGGWRFASGMARLALPFDPFLGVGDPPAVGFRRVPGVVAGHQRAAGNGTSAIEVAGVVPFSAGCPIRPSSVSCFSGFFIVCGRPDDGRLA